jgi:hypothetical protein
MSQNVTEGEAIYLDHVAEVSKVRITPEERRKARTEGSGEYLRSDQRQKSQP